MILDLPQPLISRQAPLVDGGIVNPPSKNVSVAPPLLAYGAQPPSHPVFVSLKGDWPRIPGSQTAGMGQWPEIWSDMRQFAKRWVDPDFKRPSVGPLVMDPAPAAAAKQNNKPDTGQCNLDRAAINLNALRDVCRTELTRLLSVRPSLTRLWALFPFLW